MRLSKQNGAALIIFAIIVSLIILTFTLRNLNGKQLEISRKDKTAKVLYEAKNALLGWSVMRGISGTSSSATPGQMPCPEDLALIGSANEGTAMASCNSSLPVVGRLPWRSLGLGDIRDGNGDKLWYVLSPGFRGPPINSDNLGQLAVNGNLNAAVAIIFSPGNLLPSQDRSTFTTSNYLDLTNNDGDMSFITTGAAGVFNDVSIILTQNELFELVEKRILREVRGDNTQGLIRFYSSQGLNNYPFADINSDGIIDIGELTGFPSYEGLDDNDPDNLFFNTRVKNILISNNWMQRINYQVAADRQSVAMTLNSQTLSVTP
jgi:hypothetical protein